MKINSMKIKQGALALVGSVMLGSFGMAFGVILPFAKRTYDFRVENKTPNKVHATVVWVPGDDFLTKLVAGYTQPKCPNAMSVELTSGATYDGKSPSDCRVFVSEVAIGTKVPGRRINPVTGKRQLLTQTQKVMFPFEQRVEGNNRWQVVGPDNDGAYKIINTK